MNNLSLKANEFGIWLVEETDQGTWFSCTDCVDWKEIAKYLKELEEEDE